MLELTFGDICIVNLARSLNSPKVKIAPVIYISSEIGEDGVELIRFCRVGKIPDNESTMPFVEVGKHPYLRRGTAIFPTQLVLFANPATILSKAGSIEDESIKKEVFSISDKAKMAEKQAIIMSLCPRCRRDFLSDSETVVKRLDPFSMVEHQCDFCQVRSGHTYIIYKRQNYGDSRK